MIWTYSRLNAEAKTCGAYAASIPPLRKTFGVWFIHSDTGIGFTAKLYPENRTWYSPEDRKLSSSTVASGISMAAA